MNVGEGTHRLRSTPELGCFAADTPNRFRSTEHVTHTEFIDKWRQVELKERASAQEHFLDLCRLLELPTPTEDDLPVRMYPFLAATYSSGSRSIAIDPHVSFGKPILAEWGITTRIIARRVIGGGTIEDLSCDYDIPPEQLEDAVVFEAA